MSGKDSVVDKVIDWAANSRILNNSVIEAVNRTMTGEHELADRRQKDLDDKELSIVVSKYENGQYAFGLLLKGTDEAKMFYQDPTGVCIRREVIGLLVSGNTYLLNTHHISWHKCPDFDHILLAAMSEFG